MKIENETQTNHVKKVSIGSNKESVQEDSGQVKSVDSDTKLAETDKE